MFELKLHNLESVNEKEFTRVVCVSRYKDKWVFSKNMKRDGWEIPGGHIEEGEDWQTAAKRELYEETGATKVKVEPICAYSISTYALLCYAEIEEMEKLPDFEISEIGFFDDIPTDLTFKDSHTVLFNKVLEVKKLKKMQEARNESL